MEQIAQLAIDAERLQMYYKVVPAGDRKELVVLKNDVITDSLSLSKFGEPVRFATCDELRARPEPHVEFVKLDIGEETASAVLRYRARAIEMRLTFARTSEGWQIRTQELVKVKFSDKGCAGKS